MKSATGKYEWLDIKVIYILIEDVIKTKQKTIKLKNWGKNKEFSCLDGYEKQI